MTQPEAKVVRRARRPHVKIRQANQAQQRPSHSLTSQIVTAGHADGPPPVPFTLVIEIDAWNIRERDGWGQTQALLEQGLKPERWHWVYRATVFRLDHRGQTAGQRAIISQRG